MQNPSTAPDTTAQSRAGLERGWSIHVTFPANAAVLTVLNPQGESEHISFALGFSGGQPLTVTDLDQVEDAALRTAAHKALEDHAARVAAGDHFELRKFMDGMMELGPVSIDHYIDRLSGKSGDANRSESPAE